MTRVNALAVQAAQLTVVAALLAPAWVDAAPKLKTNGRSILTEGLDDLLAPSNKPNKPAEKSPSWAPDREAVEDMLKKSLQGKPPTLDLGEDLGEKQENPLVRVEKSMGEATKLIDVLDKTGRTQQVQEQIVKDLDDLIEKMQKQCNCSGGNCDKPSSSRQQSQQSKRSKPKQSQQQAQKKSQQGNKPGQKKPSQSQAKSAAQQSVARLGQADGNAVQGKSSEELLKEAWGHLPQRLREQMLQSSNNEFLPQYREEIERYFERLAEEEADR